MDNSMMSLSPRKHLKGLLNVLPPVETPECLKNTLSIDVKQSSKKDNHEEKSPVKFSNLSQRNTTYADITNLNSSSDVDDSLVQEKERILKLRDKFNLKKKKKTVEFSDMSDEIVSDTTSDSCDMEQIKKNIIQRRKDSKRLTKNTHKHLKSDSTIKPSTITEWNKDLDTSSDDSLAINKDNFKSKFLRPRKSLNLNITSIIDKINTKSDDLKSDSEIKASNSSEYNEDLEISSEDSLVTNNKFKSNFLHPRKSLNLNITSIINDINTVSESHINIEDSNQTTPLKISLIKSSSVHSPAKILSDNEGNETTVQSPVALRRSPRKIKSNEIENSSQEFIKFNTPAKMLSDNEGNETTIQLQSPVELRRSSRKIKSNEIENSSQEFIKFNTPAKILSDNEGNETTVQSPVDLKRNSRKIKSNDIENSSQEFGKFNKSTEEFESLANIDESLLDDLSDVTVNSLKDLKNMKFKFFKKRKSLKLNISSDIAAMIENQSKENVNLSREIQKSVFIGSPLKSLMNIMNENASSFTKISETNVKSPKPSYSLKESLEDKSQSNSPSKSVCEEPDKNTKSNRKNHSSHLKKSLVLHDNLVSNDHDNSPEKETSQNKSQNSAEPPEGNLEFPENRNPSFKRKRKLSPRSHHNQINNNSLEKILLVENNNYLSSSPTVTESQIESITQVPEKSMNIWISSPRKRSFESSAQSQPQNSEKSLEVSVEFPKISSPSSKRNREINISSPHNQINQSLNKLSVVEESTGNNSLKKILRNKSPSNANIEISEKSESASLRNSPRRSPRKQDFKSQENQSDQNQTQKSVESSEKYEAFDFMRKSPPKINIEISGSESVLLRRSPRKFIKEHFESHNKSQEKEPESQTRHSIESIEKNEVHDNSSSPNPKINKRLSSRVSLAQINNQSVEGKDGSSNNENMVESNTIMPQKSMDISLRRSPRNSPGKRAPNSVTSKQNKTRSAQIFNASLGKNLSGSKLSERSLKTPSLKVAKFFQNSTTESTLSEVNLSTQKDNTTNSKTLPDSRSTKKANKSSIVLRNKSIDCEPSTSKTSGTASKQLTLAEFLEKMSKGKIKDTNSKPEVEQILRRPLIIESLEKTTKAPALKKPKRNLPKTRLKGFPPKMNKALLEHFCKHKVSREATKAFQEVSETFFEHLASDLNVIMTSKRDKVVTKDHSYLLMKELKLVQSKADLHKQLRDMLPVNEWEKVIPIKYAFNKVLP